jgi:hypothetical protein
LVGKSLDFAEIKDAAPRNVLLTSLSAEIVDGDDIGVAESRDGAGFAVETVRRSAEALSMRRTFIAIEAAIVAAVNVRKETRVLVH